MQKRGLFSLLVVISILVVIFIVKAQAPTGVCYTIEPGRPCVLANSCDEIGPTGKIFETGGIEVYQACLESVGCCCYGEIDSGIFSSRVCVSDYLVNRSFNPAIKDATVCDAVCKGITPACKYTGCEEANTFTADFPSCKCGTIEINQNNPYCCAAGNQGYVNQVTCFESEDSA